MRLFPTLTNLAHCHISDTQDRRTTMELINRIGMPVQFRLPATAHNKSKLYEISAQGLQTLTQRSECESSSSCWLNDEVKFRQYTILGMNISKSSITSVALSSCRL